MHTTHALCLHCKAPVFISNSAYCCAGCETIASLLQGRPLSERPQFAPVFILPEELSYFEDLKHRPLFESGEGIIKVFVHGISCVACALLLEKIPEFCPQVLSVQVSFNEHVLSARLAPGAPISDLLEWIYKMGFRASVLEKHESSDKLLKHENHGELLRMGIVGFFALNQMMFSVPVYAGLSGEYLRLFLYLQGLLFLPVFSYGAWPIYVGALRSLKNKILSIDLPIAIAFSVIGGLSYWDLFQGRDQIYFDSSTGFLFFILLSRWINRRLIQKSSVQFNQLEALQSPLVMSSQGEWRRASELRAGDLYVLKKGDWVPADSILVEGSAHFNCSMLSGESAEKSFAEDSEILAGLRLTRGTCQLRTQKTVKESYLSQMMTQALEQQQQKSAFADLMSKLSQALIITVLLIAIGYFFFHFSSDPYQAFQRALALMVVACPCALALAGPLALHRGLSTLSRMGFLVKSPDVLIKLAKVRNIFFDKTGTLTQSECQLESASEVSLENKQIILSLERISQHPIAEALRREWPGVESLTVKHSQEIPGQGVCGQIQEQDFEFVRGFGKTTELRRNGQTILSLRFKDRLLPGAQNLVASLQRKKKVFLLSGDNENNAAELGATLAIPKDRVWASLKPEDKQKIIQSFEHTLMVGDGINDSLALSAASVSLAVSGSLIQAIKSADVYLTHGQLVAVSKLLIVAQETQKIFTRNMVFALVYNLTAGSAALLGWVNPLVAAILMPISSAVLATSSYWGTPSLRKIRETL